MPSSLCALRGPGGNRSLVNGVIVGTMLSVSGAITVLNRLTFGATFAERERLRLRGLAKWLDEQLAPAAEDQRLHEVLGAVRLKVSREVDGERVVAQRGLDALLTTEQAWTLGSEPPREQGLVREQLAAATVVRAVHAERQLYEMVCLFWHDHFSVDGRLGRVAVHLPAYDLDAVRPHAIGNFRQLLGAVARSAAMLLYLDNASSRVGRPNENFARELLELHTLGRGRYFNDLYDRWSAVPGAKRGRPTGYIDEDVYEVARAFTGWGVAKELPMSSPEETPQKGPFAYREAWHDNYQKRVLASEFPPFQAPLADGEQVLDLLASHPGTAEHICRKLCVRFVSENPPASLVGRLVKIWLRAQKEPDQIARVIRALALAPEFLAARPSKAKRPLELVSGFVRATGMRQFLPTIRFLSELDSSGHRLMSWPTPAGHPESTDFWLSSDGMRKRWNLMHGLVTNRWECGTLELPQGSDMTFGQALARFAEGMFGDESKTLVEQVLSGMGVQGIQRVTSTRDEQKLQRAVAYLGMSPRFQER